jgi:hypothetical protein
MNCAFLRFPNFPPCVRTSLSASVTKLLDAIKVIWRNAEFGSIVAFVAGVLVGLLIPSREWVAIIIVIFVGAVLQSLVKAIDRKCADGRKS